MQTLSVLLSYVIMMNNNTPLHDNFFFRGGGIIVDIFFKFLEQFIFMVGKILTLIDRRGQFGSVKEFLCQIRRTTSTHNDHMTLARLSQ